MLSLQDAVETLRQEKELLEVEALVDPELELAEIHRRVVKEKGPAILFKHVINSPFPVITNLFGSEKRLDVLFKDFPKKLEIIFSLLEKPSLSALWRGRYELLPLLTQGKKWVRSLPFNTTCSLKEVPFLKCWPHDGGSFLTLPLVYTRSPITGKENLGMYRIQRHDDTECGLHFQIGKGGGFHFFEAEKLKADLPVAIFLGGPPALILSAIMPLPENVSEILFASLLLGKRLETSMSENIPLLTCCDIALLGKAKCALRHEEGPFGDHFGYLDPAKQYPVFKVEKILAKKNAIIPATVVGKPLQEDAYIGSFIQKLTRPFLSFFTPNLVDLYAYPEGGFHSCASIRIEERYEKEALRMALSVLGQGQLSLTKILFVVDSPISLDNFPLLLTELLSRIRPEEDILILSNSANDTLDMTGPEQNKGSKAIFLGVGPKRRTLPSTIASPLPCFVKKAIPFCPGCLVLEADASIDIILNHPSFTEWPYLFLVDDAETTARDQLEFLWTVFTRFEPASDIYAREKKIRRNGVSFSFPLLFDARMKPAYSSMLQPSSQTVELVDKRWHEYFPQKDT